MINFHVSLSSLPPFLPPSIPAPSLLPLEQCIADRCVLSFIVLTQSLDQIDLQTI